jgi:two-component system NtrC family response regulator
VLQEKSFERVGGVRSIAVDIRVIAATNKNLGLEMRAGRFREDLFYRLNVVHIGIPPLRERQEDIRLLVNHFLQKYAAERKSAVPVRGVAQEVDRLFYDYSWPGNVRELENVIERVMILCPNEIITGDDLPRGFKSSLDNALHIDGIPANAKLYETLEMVEKTMIQRALKMADNVQSHAAAILGIGKSGLNQKIKKYNLEVGAKS